MNDDRPISEQEYLDASLLGAKCFARISRRPSEEVRFAFDEDDGELVVAMKRRGSRSRMVFHPDEIEEALAAMAVAHGYFQRNGN